LSIKPLCAKNTTKELESERKIPPAQDWWLYIMTERRFSSRRREENHTVSTSSSKDGDFACRTYSYVYIKVMSKFCVDQLL
jgi:hypothetical protein